MLSEVLLPSLLLELALLSRGQCLQLGIEFNLFLSFLLQQSCFFFVSLLLVFSLINLLSGSLGLAMSCGRKLNLDNAVSQQENNLQEVESTLLIFRGLADQKTGAHKQGVFVKEFLVGDMNIDEGIKGVLLEKFPHVLVDHFVCDFIVLAEHYEVVGLAGAAVLTLRNGLGNWQVRRFYLCQELVEVLVVRKGSLNLRFEAEEELHGEWRD